MNEGHEKALKLLSSFGHWITGVQAAVRKHQQQQQAKQEGGQAWAQGASDNGAPGLEQWSSGGMGSNRLLPKRWNEHTIGFIGFRCDVDN